MEDFSFSLTFPGDKTLTFSTKTRGLIVAGREFLAGSDGELIYNKVQDLHASDITCQYSTNTSTLIPAFKVLSLQYNPYFDTKEVIDSQNDITFYWNPSPLAAFYNRYTTDGIELEKREPIIKEAVNFLLSTSSGGENFLVPELLSKVNEPCRLLGFYEGFPIFDGTVGLSKLASRLGIHIGVDGILVSTPMDKYQDDVAELAKQIESTLAIMGNWKKNRVWFAKTPALLALLRVSL